MKMSVCTKRVVFWLLMTAGSAAAGLALDIALGTGPFPLWARLAGLAGMVLAHFPLRRTGRLLAREGEIEGSWGCTTRLITGDIYRCLRHPHHLGVGVFVPSLGLLIGYPWTLIVMTAVQWAWILLFLRFVEERELEEKFGDEYREYRSRVPGLIPDPRCVLRVLTSGAGACERDDASSRTDTGRDRTT